MSTQFYASDACLLGIALERGDEETVDDRAGIDEMLAAIEALTAGWLVPLGVSLQFDYCDPANYFEGKGAPAQPYQFLCTDDLPPDLRVKSIFPSPMTHVVPVIDAAAIRDGVAQGLAQPAPAGLITSLSELSCEGVRVRSPLSDAIELNAPDPTSTVSRVIDAERWCFGPTNYGQAGPPATLRARNDHFTTEISLEIFWDLWVGFPAGRVLVDAGIERVLARGGWAARQYFPAVR